MNDLILSPDQASAVAQVMAWLRDSDDQTLTLGGYAGTGKTTVVSRLIQLVGRGRVAVCAFTGKAAAVLRSKGVEASTMHRLIYAPDLVCEDCMVAAHIEGCPECFSRSFLKIRFLRVPEIDADLVIVDEASMLSTRLVEDLLSFDVKVLFVGDHGQLEPVGDDPGIMAEPEIRLEQIHRQAEGSAIIQFAHLLRNGAHPATWTGGREVTVRTGLRGIDLESYDAILCGYNRTRVAVNARVRERRGFEGDPAPGERLICLHNDPDLGVFNGMLVTVTAIHGRQADREDLLVIDFEDDDGQRYPKIPILRRQFGEEKKEDWVPRGVGQFDFGYCMTVHKAQGSEWERVAVLEQLAPVWTAERWRYTAATRASRQLHYYLSERGV